MTKTQFWFLCVFFFLSSQTFARPTVLVSLHNSSLSNVSTVCLRGLSIVLSACPGIFQQSVGKAMEFTAGTALYIAIIAIAYFIPASGEQKVFYRISEQQFNDIAEDLFALVKKDIGDFSSSDGLAYETEPIGKAESLTVTIPRDGILKTVAYFDHISVMGGVNLQIQGTSFYDYSTEVRFKNCTLISEGKIESTVTVDTSEGKKTSFQVSGCRFDCMDFGMPTQYDRMLAEYINTSELLRRFETAVCQIYKVNFNLVFKAKGLKIEIGHLLNGMSEFGNVRVQIVDRAILLTLEKATSLPANSGPAYDIWEPLPGFFEQDQPFEIFFTNDTIDENSEEYRRGIFRSNRSVTISEVLQNIPPKFVQQIGYLIPNLGATFPNSTFDVIIRDIALRSTIRNNSFWLHGTTTGHVTATLNCNPNRTFTAFRFTAILEAPLQLTFNHRILGLKFTTFRGNFTIQDSKIGKIADHFLESIFYILPQVAVNKKLLEATDLHGIKLSRLLPNNSYMENVKISIREGYIAVGGTLTKTNREHDTIPYENLTWAGEIGDLDSFSFPLVDPTPANATGLSIQNCTVQRPGAVSSSQTITTPFKSCAMTTIYLMIYLLSRVASG